jgi:hypothetical protein
MLGPALLLLTLLGEPSLTAAPACPPELFRIGRSKNANVIVYEARQSSPGVLDSSGPVEASWVLLAAHGEREKLSWFEWRMAYGFDVRPTNPGPGFVFTFKAKEDRPIRIVLHHGCPVGLATIGGRQGILKRIFIQAEDHYLIPSVEYVEVFGSDLETGEDLYERIVVSTPQPPQGELMP